LDYAWHAIFNADHPAQPGPGPGPPPCVIHPAVSKFFFSDAGLLEASGGNPTTNLSPGPMEAPGLSGSIAVSALQPPIAVYWPGREQTLILSQPVRKPVASQTDDLAGACGIWDRWIRLDCV